MTSKARRLQLLGWAGLVLIIGLAYALFCTLSGLALPCPLRLTTGLLCPGCGVTRMCLALLRLDVAGAWHANPGLLLLLPPLGLLLGRLAWRYVREGSRRLSRWENGLVWVMVGVMMVYAILRNLL